MKLSKQQQEFKEWLEITGIKIYDTVKVIAAPLKSHAAWASRVEIGTVGSLIGLGGDVNDADWDACCVYIYISPSHTALLPYYCVIKIEDEEETLNK